MGFQQGLSGLNSSSKSLEVIGNNVANANTYGAKSSRAEFADMYAASLGGSGTNKVGIGVRVAAVAQQFTQGNLTTTSNPLDIAINGDGFFMVQRWDPVNGTENLQAAGERLYSRNGQFKVDSSGYIVNNEGHKVLSNDSNPIKLNLTGGAAQATTRITADLNLNATDGTDNPFDATQYPPVSGTFSFATTQTLYDGSGEAVPMEYYFRKSNVDQWEVYSAVGGSYLNAGNPAFTVDFDPSTSLPTQITDSAGTTSSGVGLASVALPTIPADGTRSAISGVTVDFSGITQYAGSSTINELTQTGYPKGDFSSFQIDSNGAVLVRYTNGVTEVGGQLGLARFTNSQGLQPVGGNEWKDTSASGAPLVDKPGSGRFGLLQGGALEESNVDLTGELVNMIVAQRAYQANAQTIKTEDQVLQTLVNLR
ncbi:flagellar hook protein FlgE [Aquabacterium sp.]|uniref:flagellar hook protein FlgE n=1 Tax=Aquabacterium sp. TaxID=1872578 RepID=UPI002614AFE4|nr:flagellar hook protein FlgE [Aquabacterium sp.]MDD2975651.1 flagellar hook protein FlgE [Aquabacterium sp.]